jgi:hypothetical protein
VGGRCVGVGGSRRPPLRTSQSYWLSLSVGFAEGAVAKINPSNPSSPEVLWTHSGFGNDASSIIVDGGIIWVAGGPISNL